MKVIYKITSPTGRLYVGQTKDYSRRISDYKSLRHRSKRSIIIWSIKKYGWENHQIEVLEEVQDELRLNEREIFWIQKLQTYVYENENGMNLTKGGAGTVTTWKHDKERVAKAKLRCGVNAPGYGKKFTEEARKKLSEVKKKQNKEIGLKPSYYAHKRSLEVKQKSVVVYDKFGAFVGEYPSRLIAAKSLGLDRKCVIDAANGKQTNAGGFVIKNYTDNYPKKIDTSGLNLYSHKRPVLCFLNSMCIEYESVEKAAADLNYDRTCIIERAKLKQFKPSRKGYIFCYKDEYELMQLAV